MKILVTGGLGFIGANFIDYWRRHYPADAIVNIDSETYAASNSAKGRFAKLENYVWYKADILDVFAINRILREEQPDVVFHFAAESHVCRSIESPAKFMAVNGLGTSIVLEAFRAEVFSKKPDAVFYYVSTDEIFGELPMVRAEKFKPHTQYRPRSPYAASKLAGQALVQAYHYTYGMDVRVSSCTNNYGAHQHEEKLIPKTILSIMNGKPMTVHGKGDHVRDWIHVQDHCAAIDRIYHAGWPTKVYLVGSGDERSNLNVIRAVSDTMKSFGYPEVELKYTEDRPTDDRRYAVDAWDTKCLAWEARKEFKNAIRDVCSWYIENFARDGGAPGARYPGSLSDRQAADSGPAGAVLAGHEVHGHGESVL